MMGYRVASGDDFEPESFLSQLTAEELDAFKAAASRRQYRKGTTLFNEGDISDRVVAVVEGRAKISYFTAEGKEILLAVRGPGDLLGELSAIDGEPRSATVSALEPVQALTLAAGDFRAFLEAHPRVALLILEMLSRRLRDADRKRVEFAAYDTVGRVAARLVELSREHGEAERETVRITLPLSQEELAGWTGASREAVAKALHTLRSAGWVETQRRRITVLDLQALRRRAT